MNGKRHLKALAGLILFSAITHMIVLFIYAAMKGDIVILNYFNILDFDLVFPGMIYGTTSQILSLVTAVVIYLVFYIFFTKKK